MYLQNSFVVVRLRDSRNTDIADLESLGITDAQFEREVLPMMKQCQWSHINLGNNRLTDRSVIYLADEIGKEPYKTCLTTLVLTRNQVQTSGIVELCDRVDSCALRILKLDYNKISVDGIVSIWDALTRWRSLEELNLDGNSVSENCFARFGANLRGSILQTLHLSRTSFTDECLRLLCEGLTQSSLKRLQLSKNLIHDVGLEYIAGVLKETSLEVLDLSQNQIIGDIDRFCQALKGSSLTKANLSGNKISERGAQNLIKGVKGSNIVELNLYWNGLSEDMLNEVRQAVHFPKTSVYGTMLTLCSARERVGVGSWIRVLPQELIRKVVEMLYPMETQ